MLPHLTLLPPPVVATPPVDATPPTIVTLSSENTPNMPTNDGYWYNSNEGGGVPNDGNDGQTHPSPGNEDNSTRMKRSLVDHQMWVLQSKLQWRDR